jgi:predicted DNA-binding transcriptional regulator AlpA
MDKHNAPRFSKVMVDERKARRFLRKKKVAERYDTTERSIERKVEQGILPEPYYFGSRFPRWAEDELDAADRAALKAS